jgi:hypothetical protein
MPRATAARHDKRAAPRHSDPLFDQPYVSPQSTVEPDRKKPENVSGSLVSGPARKKEKQIAALFLPPATKTDA